MNKKTTVIILLAAALIAILGTQAYGYNLLHATNNTSNSPSGSASSKDGISVQGTGQVSIAPDRGILTVGIITQNAKATIAVQNNSNIANAVITALNSIGINNSEIQTIYYDLYTQESWNTSPPIITGYEVTNELQVTIVASGQTTAQLGIEVGHAIDAAIAGGANEIYGVEFTASSSALKEAQQTALQQATTDASQKAHIIASALGLTITGVISVTTNPVYPQPFYWGGAIAVSANTTPIVPPQTLTATATVQATFSTN